MTSQVVESWNATPRDIAKKNFYPEIVNYLEELKNENSVN